MANAYKRFLPVGELPRSLQVVRNGVTISIRRDEVSPDDWLATAIVRSAMMSLCDQLDRLAEVRQIESGK